MKGSIRGVPLTGAPIVVFLDGATRPARTHTVQQKEMHFVPESSVIAVGDTVEFPNTDNVTHNVFSVSPAKKFDLGFFKEGVKKSVTFSAQGHVDVFCNIHSNMHASVDVVPSGYAAVVDERGNFELNGIPRGHHSLVVLRKGARLGQRDIDVGPKGVVQADFALK